LAIGIGLGTEYYFPVLDVEWVLSGPASTFIFAAGCVIFLLTQREFNRYSTAVSGKEASSAIVTTGPMRFSRNPIYISFLLTHFSIAVFFSSGWVLLSLGLVFVVINYIVIGREEPYLEARFGSAYLSYKQSVRRWV
jgi:protein-S-isoprenylcysteine O-methyltransferase Ste14